MPLRIICSTIFNVSLIVASLINTKQPSPITQGRTMISQNCQACRISGSASIRFVLITNIAN